MQPFSVTPAFLRRKDVERLTGLARSTIYAHAKAGQFPKPVPLVSPRCVGWRTTDIMEWIERRPQSRAVKPETDE